MWSVDFFSAFHLDDCFVDKEYEAVDFIDRNWTQPSIEYHKHNDYVTLEIIYLSDFAADDCLNHGDFWSNLISDLAVSITVIGQEGPLHHDLTVMVLFKSTILCNQGDEHAGYGLLLLILCYMTSKCPLTLT